MAGGDFKSCVARCARFFSQRKLGWRYKASSRASLAPLASFLAGSWDGDTRLHVVRRSLRSLLFSKEAGMAGKTSSQRSLAALASFSKARFFPRSGVCVRLRAAACVVCVVRSFWIARTRACLFSASHCTSGSLGARNALAHGSPSASRRINGSLGAWLVQGSRARLSLGVSLY